MKSNFRVNSSMNIIEWFKLPEMKYIHDLDDPSITALHAKIIQEKPFLKKLYIDFYNQFRNSIPGSIKTKFLVEFGSGGGFIKDIIPNVITSDIIKLPNVDKHFSALDVPFENNKVDAFFMIDVLHHLKDARVFFREVNRCLKIGGKMIMIEPANTLWSRFIYQNFHHESFNSSGGWSLIECPLSSANSAIPWIIFYRDKQYFEKEFPSLKILKSQIHTPFRYLISGGVSMRQLMPSFTYSIVKCFETILSPLNKYVGMFLTVEIEKVL